MSEDLMLRRRALMARLAAGRQKEAYLVRANQGMILTSGVPETGVNRGYEAKFIVWDNELATQYHHLLSTANYSAPYLRVDNGTRVLAVQRGGGTVIAEVDFEWGVPHVVRAFVDDDSVWLDGVELLKDVPLGSGEGTAPYFFTFPSNPLSGTYLNRTALAWLKVYEDGVLTEHYVPEQRVMDGKCGLLEVLSGNLLLAHTGRVGRFNYGEDDFTIEWL